MGPACGPGFARVRCPALQGPWSRALATWVRGACYPGDCEEPANSGACYRCGPWPIRYGEPPIQGSASAHGFAPLRCATLQGPYCGEPAVLGSVSGPGFLRLQRPALQGPCCGALATWVWGAWFPGTFSMPQASRDCEVLHCRPPCARPWSVGYTEPAMLEAASDSGFMRLRCRTLQCPRPGGA